MNASVHNWFTGAICHLHLTFDDARSRVLAGHFEEKEALHGYYYVTRQVVRYCGVPEEFYNDRRRVFSSKTTKTSRSVCKYYPKTICGRRRAIR
jgi:hypothetical protein